MDKVIEALNKRYATKKFDITKKLSQEQVDFIKEVLRLTPSSSGIQPWKFIVINNPEVRNQLAQAAWNQPQITESSMLIVFCARMDLSESGKEQVDLTKKIRGLDDEQIAGYSNMVMGQVGGMETEEAIYNFGANMTFIALGNLINALATVGIDACPMGGFSKDEFDKILSLKEKNLRSTVICAIGFRDQNDKAATNKKVRFMKEDIFIEM